MKSFIVTMVLILTSITGAFAQQLKSANRHENNPYYSNTDTKKLNVPDAEWKKILSPALYATARKQATEKPFTGQYWNKNARGTYYCAACEDTEVIVAAI